MKKNYSRPAMVMETFVPNEYCDSCWLVTLDCVGQSDTQGWEISDVYPWGTTDKHTVDPIGNVHYNGHTAHTTPVITVHIEGDGTFDPTQIDQYDIVDDAGIHVEVFWIIANGCKSAYNKKCPTLNGTKKCNSEKWEI